MNVQVMVTVSGSNQADLIRVLSDKTHALGGKWLNSKISHIDSYVAGLIKIEIDADNVEKLTAEFKALDINVEAVNLGRVTHEKSTPLDLCIDGKDRPGLVRHITQVLSDNSIIVENMECNRLGVPAIGGTLFTSHFKIVVDEQFDKAGLVASLQDIAEDLIIDLSA
ncbi:glycine cleavage system protein R [Psychromonas hadalis]|uniref:glycine cleavage system protein R n=1 Tax=Psychromonas hadalis TaxID=211669 RepID=UPI0003B7723B|nr:ACT domain-containing protein [Psychromonas hadalis]